MCKKNIIPDYSLACLIMASGASKRFGSNKLLTQFHGQTLFENALKISRYVSFAQTLAVTRHDAVAEICIRERVPFLKHDMPHRNHMIHLGVSRLLSDCSQNGNPDDCLAGILFLPADQPLVSQKSMQELCRSFLYYGDKICRLSYKGMPGSPVIFPQRYYKELLNLPEKKGGGFIIKKYPEQVITVPAQDKYELYDIDTPEDLTFLLSAESHSE